jgi:hypothetical protein
MHQKVHSIVSPEASRLNCNATAPPTYKWLRTKPSWSTHGVRWGGRSWALRPHSYGCKVVQPLQKASLPQWHGPLPGICSRETGTYVHIKLHRNVHGHSTLRHQKLTCKHFSPGELVNKLVSPIQYYPVLQKGKHWCTQQLGWISRALSRERNPITKGYVHRFYLFGILEKRTKILGVGGGQGARV